MKQFRPEMEGGRATRRGFTMVEVLTVVAVMAILMSVVAVGIQNIDRGQATTSALAVSEAVFDEARSAAVGRGARARVLIHNNLNDQDEDDRNRYLRYLAVAVHDAELDEWQLVSRGTQMPAGVYFDPELSEQASSSLPGIGTWGTTTIRLPGRDRGTKSCYYYEFNGEGICIDGGENATEVDPEVLPGAAFVLVGGARPSGRAKPIMQGKNRTGFVVWRNGRTALYRSPDQIDQ